LNVADRAIRACEVIAADGRSVPAYFSGNTLHLHQLSAGTYTVRVLFVDGGVRTARLQVVR
jgi:hypothetical protein